MRTRSIATIVVVSLLAATQARAHWLVPPPAPAPSTAPQVTPAKPEPAPVAAFESPPQVVAPAKPAPAPVAAFESPPQVAPPPGPLPPAPARRPLPSSLQLPPAPPPVPPAPPRANIHLELPLYDAPFNTLGGYSAPSMRQSLALSKDVYGLAHWGIDQLQPGETTWWEAMAIITFDVLMTWAPPSEGWTHEEWHRAVMTNRGVSSHNDINDLPFFRTLISVSHETDADLVRMKLQYPADFVRLPAAGIEGEYELLLAMEKDAFFRDTRTFNSGLYWFVKLNSWLYVRDSGASGADARTDELNAQEGTSIAVRDFTGLDFTAWVYDLHRPDEPYQARGIHPSGLGLDRYIRFSDLSGPERDYLRLQGYLQLLNFLDPNLIGLHRFTARRGGTDSPSRSIDWMLSAFHLLTPFGFDAGLNLFLRDERRALHARFHGYSSGSHPVLPGLEAELVSTPVRVGSQTLLVTPRLSLWLQPDRLRFEGTGMRPGLQASLRAAWPFAAAAWVFLEGDAKTQGWVPGNVALDAAVSARAGVEATVF